ncbi:MAG TPA: AAA family ATPase, partial [Terriglobia bacterium]|nr:AAA family ATPase [Terriglobia bacterium]
PEVLHNLRDNPKRFQRFSEAVRKILPEVKEVTIKSVANQQVEIRIWPVDPSTERDDLAIPLRESGTGIGQVLAILYVIMNSDQPQILLIDEPQSFLHPGALRKLIEVFKQYSQHQYIISTHAPAVISAANPDVIINILQEEHQSIPRPFNFSNKDELQVCLAQLGASLSDVFGADNIVWVEGPTEAICYPKILSQIAKEPLMGTAIVPVRNTGELQGKRDAERVVDLYNRMSGSNALIPPAISFVFDSECYTDERKEENSNRSAGKAKFLPRRMYECYLLNPRAIANVANSIPGFRETKLTEEEVAELLRQKFETVEYYCQQPIPDNADERRSKINGAKVLRDLFNKLSETRVAFDKLEHSVKLTDWLLKNEPEELKDLADFLVAAVRGRNPK